MEKDVDWGKGTIVALISARFKTTEQSVCSRDPDYKEKLDTAWNCLFSKLRNTTIHSNRSWSTLVKKQVLALSCCVAVLLTACADTAGNVKGTYISPIVYSDYSCKQLAAEAGRLSARASEAAGVQDKKAQNDAVATGVSLVLFWPAVFFIGGNGESKQDLARLKGEMEAVEAAAIKKNCGIKFQN